jgi:hypothetical protein
MPVSLSRRLIDTLLNTLMVIAEAFTSLAVLEGAYSRTCGVQHVQWKNGVE